MLRIPGFDSHPDNPHQGRNHDEETHLFASGKIVARSGTVAEFEHERNL